jgi:glyoxylase-like metal-dependent hydrolase (beta-lactamase superfamily II)
VVELRGSSSFGTFRSYRGLPEAVHGMIAWPNTVLLTGPETVVVDPGYQTQGDMLAGALAARGLSPDDVRTVLATHLHSDHVSALPQLGEVELVVHEAELATPHAAAGRGWRDRATERPLTGVSGEALPGVRWIHTPGHTDGHVAYLVETEAGPVAIAGDTPGPDPSWFAEGRLPDDHPRRDEHLAAFRAIRESGATVMIPGHNPPQAVAAA